MIQHKIDSGAHISLVSKDLVSESDMVPGKITIKSVLGQSQTLPCAGLNVAINGVSKYYKLVVSDRIGSMAQRWLKDRGMAATEQVFYSHYMYIIFLFSGYFFLYID